MMIRWDPGWLAWLKGAVERCWLCAHYSSLLAACEWWERTKARGGVKRFSKREVIKAAEGAKGMIRKQPPAAPFWTCHFQKPCHQKEGKGKLVSVTCRTGTHSLNTSWQLGRYLDGQLISEGVSPSESFWRNHSCLGFPVLFCTKKKKKNFR